jgi:hypothetical protein
VSGHFTTINVVDFEYETSGGEYNLKDGDLPVPLWMVAYVLDENLQHVRTIRMWREEPIGLNTAAIRYWPRCALCCLQRMGRDDHFQAMRLAISNLYF